MSTSSPRGAGVVRMLDDADVIRRKFKTAVTDSGREVRRAADKLGVTSLIDILSVATGETPEAIEALRRRGLRRSSRWRRRSSSCSCRSNATPGLRGGQAAPGRCSRGGGQGAEGIGTDARGDLRPDGVREALAAAGHRGQEACEGAPIAPVPRATRTSGICTSSG